VPRLSRRARWALLAILVVGLAARVGWVATYSDPPEGDLTDPVLYGVLADQVADGHGYTYPGADAGPTAYYPPGYPTTLGAAVWLVDLAPGDVSTFQVAVGLNLVLGMATLLLVFELGRRIVSVPVGLVATGIMALWPNLVVHTGVVLTETMFLFFFAAMLLAALASPEVARRPGWGRVVAIGLLCGAAGMIRPTSFVIVPVFLWLWLPEGSRVGLRRFAVACGAVALLVLPWTARNALQMDAPVLISTNLGDNLCIGNNPTATGGYQLAESCFAGLHGGARPEAETDRQSQTFSKGIDYITGDVWHFVRMVPTKLGATLDGDTDGLWAATSYGTHEIASVDRYEDLKALANDYYVVVLVVSLVGAAILWLPYPGNRRTDFLILTALVQLVPVMVTFGDPRFKMPLYPAMAICAATAIVAAAQRQLPRPTAAAADR
jgi:4-amino-4-deoxy-L-arabinose transferase-like glycosyltransferase